MLLRLLPVIALFGVLIALLPAQEPPAVIRINLLGYRPESPKTAVWGSLVERRLNQFQLIDEQTQQPVQQVSCLANTVRSNRHTDLIFLPFINRAATTSALTTELSRPFFASLTTSMRARPISACATCVSNEAVIIRF